jgi:hypothetical protein
MGKMGLPIYKNGQAAAHLQKWAKCFCPFTEMGKMFLPICENRQILIFFFFLFFFFQKILLIFFFFNFLLSTLFL